MSHLASLSRLRVRPTSETGSAFDMLTRPTALQTEAFRLLEFRISRNLSSKLAYGSGHMS